MKNKIGIIILMLTTSVWANFNFGECSGSGTFEQEIVYYNGNYENVAMVGIIPQGIQGLRIDLISDKDVDIRLYGENNDKIVHWPYGILSKSYLETKEYKEVGVTYSGYNGVNDEKGHEFISIVSSTPTTMSMKAFGYQSGYATVNYSWTGKDGCSINESGTGDFTQTLEQNATSLVGTIPPNVNNVQINLTSDKDLDIQLYGADGTAIASWKPTGLMSGATEQSIRYKDMNITWSGYNGVEGQNGHEFINIIGLTTEVLIMKVFGYEAGLVDVTYSWGDLTTLTTDTSTYDLNESITVNISNQAEDNQNWVGIYHAEDTNDWDNMIRWDWTHGLDIITLEGLLEAGNYEARLFYNNSFDVEAKIAFTVVVPEVTLAYPEDVELAPRATDFNIQAPQIDAPIIDSVFHTRIHKVDKVGGYLSPYPKVQAWNKDETLLRIQNRLYNAKTLKETDLTKGQNETSAYNTLCNRNSDYFRWSNVNANRFYVINSDNEFIRAEITGNSVDCSHVLDAFNDYDVVHMGPHEGNIDYADKHVVFLAKKAGDTTLYVILLDITTGNRVWTKTLPFDQWQLDNGRWQPTTVDWISVSPSGNSIVLNHDNGNTDGMYRYDINLENKTKLQYMWEGNGQLYSEGGHGDIGYDTEGNEVFVQFISGVGVYSFNLDKPTQLGKKLLNSPYGAGHISCRNTGRKGWCYVATKGTNYQRVFALKLDGTQNETVENFTQTYLPDDRYSYGSVNPSGTQVIFNSYWSEVAGAYGTYIAEAEANGGVNNEDKYAEVGKYIDEVDVNYDNPKYVVYKPLNHLDNAPIVLFAGMTDAESHKGLMRFIASRGCYVIGNRNMPSKNGAYVGLTIFKDAIANALQEHPTLDVSKLGIVGHSQGGGEAFKIMEYFKDDAFNYGSQKSFVISLDGWFSFFMNRTDLQNLNTDSLFIQYGGTLGTGTDPRISLSMSKLLPANTKKGFTTVSNTSHGYSYGDLASITNKTDLLKPIGAMIDYEFFNDLAASNSAFGTYNNTFSSIVDSLENNNGIDYMCDGTGPGGALDTVNDYDVDYCTDYQ